MAEEKVRQTDGQNDKQPDKRNQNTIAPDRLSQSGTIISLPHQHKVT